MHFAARRSTFYVILVLLAIGAGTGSAGATSHSSANATSDVRLLVKFPQRLQMPRSRVNCRMSARVSFGRCRHWV